jgi:hypothetical protein
MRRDRQLTPLKRAKSKMRITDGATREGLSIVRNAHAQFSLQRRAAHDALRKTRIVGACATSQRALTARR